ncbi:MAG: NAD-dependent epimerase/dehydratase family protein [Bacteroidales bacterium]|nr:NAD-dependent epimerase/dehydratase family protein [Bacteroidales bacterium]
MILVTGGTGLVGSHLLFKLTSQNNQVRVIFRNRNKIADVKKVFAYYSADYKSLFQKIEWFSADILDFESLQKAFEGITEVYHCAALVAIGGISKSTLIHNNVQGTENIVNLSLDNSIKKLCYISSIASLGEPETPTSISEKEKWSTSKNRSAYSVSKYKSEMEVWRGIQEGLNAVIVNPSVILGAGFWESGSGSLFTKAAKGINYYTTGGTGFVDVRDVADIMIRLMNSNISSERFILNSENLTYKQLFDLIAEKMNVAKPKRKATKTLLQVANILDCIASSLKIKKREITSDVVRSSLSISEYSNTKIKETLDYNFIPISKSLEDIAHKFRIG